MYFFFLEKFLVKQQKKYLKGKLLKLLSTIEDRATTRKKCYRKKIFWVEGLWIKSK